jgi:hypothetical protein
LRKWEDASLLWPVDETRVRQQKETHGITSVDAFAVLLRACLHACLDLALRRLCILHLFVKDAAFCYFTKTERMATSLFIRVYTYNEETFTLLVPHAR